MGFWERNRSERKDQLNRRVGKKNVLRSLDERQTLTTYQRPNEGGKGAQHVALW